MISVLTVPIESVKDGPYRNTDSPFKKGHFRTFENLVANLIDRAKAGNTLSIHVAQISDSYLVLDGHICADVHRYIGTKEVAVILHDEITTEKAALEAYIAFNYLRTDWRDAVRLGVQLSELGKLNGDGSAIKLMTDGQTAIDLIRIARTRWWEYDSGQKATIPILDDPLEDLSTNDKKLRGSSAMASILIHTAEAHKKPPRRSRRKTP